MLVSQEVRRGAQGASYVAPGKLGLDACGEGEPTELSGRLALYLSFSCSRRVLMVVTVKILIKP